MNVDFFYKDIESGFIDEKRYSTLIENVLEKENCRKGKISIIFTSDIALRKLNKKFLKRNYLTDIIAFNNSFKNCIAGDIYISIDRIKENSLKYSGGEFNKELKRIVIHGILHLIGYNDKAQKEKDLMSAKEELYLNL